MSHRRYVSYARVSTQRQGASGLGLDAQRAAVAQYLTAVAKAAPDAVLAEFVEVETGKGSNALDRRPELRKALAVCKRQGAVLVIAKLDRLARNVHFVSGLLESGVEFRAADMPQADKFMIQVYACMSEWERDAISARTKAALAEAKKRGTKLGVAGPANLRPNIEARQAAADQFAANMAGVIAGFRARGLSQVKMVSELNALRVPTAAGKGTWSRQQLQRVLARLPAAGLL